MENLKFLIEKAKAGDKEAFGEIYKLYFTKIFRYCKFNTYDDFVAQDICQETFVKAWKNIKSFDLQRPDWSFQAFLFTIARNLIIDRSRRKKELNIEKYENLETNEDFYEDIDRQENVNIVKQAIAKLEETERQIIILRYFEEMDTKVVAGILGIKHGALRVRIHRTMDKLRKIIEALYGKRN